MSRKRSRTDFRYPIENRKAVIEIKLPHIGEVFDDWDPSPATIRDLDEEIEEYLISCVQEIGPKQLGKVRFFFDQKPSEPEVKALINAFSDFFKVQEHKELVNVKAVLKLGLKSLILGLSFLILAIFTSKFVHSNSPVFWEAVLKEGFLLLGWVSMWKPINIFLYDWWPFLDRVKIFNCLSQVDLEVGDVQTLRNLQNGVARIGENNVENLDTYSS